MVRILLSKVDSGKYLRRIIWTHFDCYIDPWIDLRVLFRVSVREYPCRMMIVNRRSVLKEIVHGIPNHAIESLITFYRFCENNVTSRPIDRSIVHGDHVGQLLFTYLDGDHSWIWNASVPLDTFLKKPPLFRCCCQKRGD